MKLTQKQLTAYHETGHSVFAWLIGYYSHEVTIKPSKNSLGYEKSDPNLISYMEFSLSKDGTKHHLRQGQIYMKWVLLHLV